MAVPGSYMDGVKVKISEKYKPPPRITLPMSYAQRLTLNKQTQDALPTYDFALEKTVIDKMREWKMARNTYKKDLQSRLEKARLEAQIRLKEIQNEEVDTFEPKQSTYEYRATISPNSNILTPIPVKQSVVNHQSQDKSPFNISDFEADTSSPFDNMELKSINDMEQLAQVLNNENEANTPTIANKYSMQQQPTNYNYSFSIPNTYATSGYGRNGYYYPPETIPSGSLYSGSTFNHNVNRTNFTAPVNNSVPHILKSLNDRLDDVCINTKKEETEKTEESEDLGVFHSLPKNCQDVAKGISSMGFPLSRVAKVCKHLGDDQKKVLDHLLAMSELLDLGFAESIVSEALLKSDNDRDKALDLLTL